jgi:hypothetical protein
MLNMHDWSHLFQFVDLEKFVLGPERDKQNTAHVDDSCSRAPALQIRRHSSEKKNQEEKERKKEKEIEERK